MDALRVLLPAVVLILTCMSWSHSLPSPLNNTDDDREDNYSLNRNKRSGLSPLGILGLCVSVGSTIQGAVCTFSSICGNDPLPEMLQSLQVQFDAIESSLSSLQSDVADIWQESKRSWYFDQITYASHLRKEVLKIREVDQQNAFHEVKVQRFIDEVLGEKGNDKNVLQALYYIPRLVIEGGLIEHYLRNQKLKHPDNTREAARKTWELIKNIFELQIDGYGSVVIAYGFKYRFPRPAKQLRKKIKRCTKSETQYNSFVEKYKGKKPTLDFDEFLEKFTSHAKNVPVCDRYVRLLHGININKKAYMHALSEICKLWTSGDKEFNAKCSEVDIDQPYLQDRRKRQQDHIFTIDELFQYPALQVEVDCRADGTEGLALAAIGENSHSFWGYHQEEKQLRKVNRKNKAVTNVILPKDCTPKYDTDEADCYPFDVSVSLHGSFRLAVAARTRFEDIYSEQHLLLYTYNQRTGKLHLECKKTIEGGQYGRLKSVVMCGDYFGYQTIMGKIELFNLACYKEEPVSAKTWNLNNLFQHRYLRCSNKGTHLLVESILSSHYHRPHSYFWGFAAINLKSTKEHNPDLSFTDNVKSQAEIMVEDTDLPWKDHNGRLEDLAGLGLDSKGNFFIASSALSGGFSTGSSVGGIYMRTSDNKLRKIREYLRGDFIKFDDLAIDEDGFLYVEQRDLEDINTKCVHKYHPEVDFDQVKLTWTAAQ